MKNIIREYLDNENRNRILKMIFDQAAWNWIKTNIGLFNYRVETCEQIGKAYIGPNPNYSENSNCHGNLTSWGYYWAFTNDKSYIKIVYNTIKNQYLDINEDTEAILSFDEFYKYCS